jgi:hypothetical protein
MTVDRALMQRLAATEPAAAVEEHYGQPGMAALRLLARGLELIGEQLAFELLTGGLIVFVTLDPENRPLSDLGSAQLRYEQLSAAVRDAATIQVLEDDLIVSDAVPDLAELSATALVYRFDGNDHLVFAGELWAVSNPTSFPSRWRTPTFFDLAEALEHYQTAVAPTCRCPHLRLVWHDPERRWLLKNKPEFTFQDSLEQHLISSLRLGRVELRREQPVGDRKPPDIKVTWSQTNRMALIEVKWMGASVHATELRISWQPDAAEANKGATQLVGYLEQNAQETPEHQTMGFLVVFDARRKDIAYDTTDLSSEQATYFANRDIVYDPDYSATRSDFAPPLRCFMQPLKR